MIKYKLNIYTFPWAPVILQKASDDPEKKNEKVRLSKERVKWWRRGRRKERKEGKEKEKGKGRAQERESACNIIHRTWITLSHVEVIPPEKTFPGVSWPANLPSLNDPVLYKYTHKHIIHTHTHTLHTHTSSTSLSMLPSWKNKGFLASTII